MILQGRLNSWYQNSDKANQVRGNFEGSGGSGGTDLRTFAQADLSGCRGEAEAERDALQSERFVEALQSVLCERTDSRHFAIGLFGDWGRGKSSFVGFLKKKLLPESPVTKPKQPEFLVAEFNAWKNEKASHHGAMLAQSVLERLIEGLSFSERLKLAVDLHALRSRGWRTAVGQDIKTGYSWFLMLVPMFTALTIVGLPLWLLCWGSSLGFWKALVAGAVAFVGVAFHAVPAFLRDNLTEWFKKADVTKLASWFKLPDYGEHRGLLGEIHKTLGFLCELQLGRKNRHLLLVIDDLDRCRVDTVKEVLDAVRLVADIPRVVTLVAIDPRMAYAAVEKHYDQFGHAGREPAQVARDYLAKVFQVSLSLPQIGEDEIRSFVENVLIPECELKEPEPPKPDATRSTVLDETPLDEGVLSGPVVPSKENDRDSPVKKPEPESQDEETDHKVLPEERELFQDLARDFGFGNPRLMGRLYFAWRMLKFLVFCREVSGSNPPSYVSVPYRTGAYENLIRLLFWREWLLQQEARLREQYENWFKSGEGKAPSLENIAKLAGGLRELRDGEVADLSFAEAEERADLVLLPASASSRQKQRQTSGSGEEKGREGE